MAKRTKRPCVVHDHLDGSAHCVECRGNCGLTGESLALTSLVRYLLEQEQMGSIKLFGSVAWTLAEAVGSERLEALRKRARTSLAGVRQ